MFNISLVFLLDKTNNMSKTLFSPNPHAFVGTTRSKMPAVWTPLNIPYIIRMSTYFMQTLHYIAIK